MNEEKINKIVELFDKGYCNECNELNCLGGEPSSRNVANAIRQLQQENKELKEHLSLWHNSYQEEADKRLKLKGIIEKAKEYIETNELYHYEYDDEETFEVIKSNKKDLLKILNGDDK